ncbi:hypothetical protein ABEB36_013716 [Hypothenemus hampei]|uniref:Transposase Tc1-like domain-containing protein n=1 Tax=Hypothenemus hampei TaxID=57062 RepID=A0ABD1E778_HYPHA
MPYLSEIQKAQIVTKLEDGWEQDHSMRRKPGSRRPKISNQEKDADFVGFLTNNPFVTAGEAANETRFSGSQPTTSRRVKESSLKNRPAAKKTLLTVEQRQLRIIFSLNYIYRDLQFCDRVIFTN